jgi:hypothetical protein
LGNLGYTIACSRSQWAKARPKRSEPGLAALCNEVEGPGKDGKFEEARDKLSDLGRSFEVARRALSALAP